MSSVIICPEGGGGRGNFFSPSPGHAVERVGAVGVILSPPPYLSADLWILYLKTT
jgi:hypothetical protein